MTDEGGTRYYWCEKCQQAVDTRGCDFYPARWDGALEAARCTGSHVWV